MGAERGDGFVMTSVSVAVVGAPGLGALGEDGMFWVALLPRGQMGETEGVPLHDGRFL